MKEVLKLLHTGIIYPVQGSEWVSPVQVASKKGGLTVIQNERNELIPHRTVSVWRITFLSPSSMRCLNGRQSTLSYATATDTLVIIKFLSIRMNRVILPSPVPTTRSLTGECCLVFGTHLLHFRGV
jgi:hypothetical protein